LYIRCTHIMRVLFCVFCMSIHRRSPPASPHATDNSTFTLYFKYFLRILCTFYLSTFCFDPVLLTLTQVVLLLITSTFTRVQIQSNLGTTDCDERDANV
jgi:hypothetical protein